MKKFIFLLAVLLLGVGTSFASDKKGEKDAENMALYKQAVKAMEDNKFIIKFHTFEGRRNRARLNQLTNFFVLDGEYISYQYDTGRRWYGTDIMGGGRHYDYPDIYEGKASNIKIEVDDKGNVTSFVSTILKGRKYITVVYKLDIKVTLKEGSNECKVIWKDKGNPRQIYYGTIHPVGATEIRKAI